MLDFSLPFFRLRLLIRRPDLHRNYRKPHPIGRLPATALRALPVSVLLAAVCCACACALSTQLPTLSAQGYEKGAAGPICMIRLSFTD